MGIRTNPNFYFYELSFQPSKLRNMDMNDCITRKDIWRHMILEPRKVKGGDFPDTTVYYDVCGW